MHLLPPTVLPWRDASAEATFCFVDLAGFTALTEAHGDHAAADLVARFGADADPATSDLVDRGAQHRAQLLVKAPRLSDLGGILLSKGSEWLLMGNADRSQLLRLDNLSPQCDPAQRG